ncbi:hypothetical protein C8F01DRAFT_105927 [Mycena amicta]|nr:hypothetical protein C8F01DRAFT_105927 [Mycena amicta]
MFLPPPTTMLAALSLFSLSLSLSARAAAPTYSATYLPSNLPDHTEEGQAGTNKCGTAANQTSQCQNTYLNALDDWCVWAPPEPGPKSDIGDTERFEVSWCLKDGYGTRLIPDGAITGAHWIITPDYVQVTGTGDLTKLNIPANDEGGELDPHGADGNGNPVGGIVFSTAFGPVQEIFEWTNFMEGNIFCFRACNPKGSNPQAYCQHIYDTMGCGWNMPGNYDPGFTSCQADSGEPMGVYGASTFHQGDPATPAPHPAPATKSCTTTSTIGNGLVVQGTSILGSSPSASATPTPTPAPSGSKTGGNSSGSGSGGAAGASATAGNSESGARSTSIHGPGGWSFVSIGSAIVFALVGAVLVL